MIVDDIYKNCLTDPCRFGAIVHPVEGEIEDYWKRNFDYIKEECHSNDEVSAISYLVLKQINSMISSGKEIQKDYIPGCPEIICGGFPFSAFDDTIYINFKVFNFDNAEQSRYFADVLGGKTEETPIRIYLCLPYINGEIDERYKNVIEHELMHAYWIHAKDGFMMSEKDYMHYKEIINSSENFNSDDEQFTMFVKALLRCLYISFGSEKSAIVQSFDKVVRERLNNGESIEYFELKESTELGNYLELLEYVLDNFATFKNKIPDVFCIDANRLYTKLYRLNNSLIGLMQNIIYRRTYE